MKEQIIQKEKERYKKLLKGNQTMFLIEELRTDYLPTAKVQNKFI